MSAKQAKRLRKAAMGLAVAVSEAGRKIHERSLYAQEHRGPVVEKGDHYIDDDGNVRESALHPKERVDEPKGPLLAVTARNRPDSLRGIIRTIKKGMKNGSLPKMPSRS